MPIIGNTFITMRDLAAGLKANGMLDHEIVELLAEQNDILDDIPFVEANAGPNNKTTIRTGLPSVSWMAAYQGVQASKGSKQQLINTSGQMSTKIEIDADLFDSDPNKAMVLQDEIKAHLQALGNEAAEAFFYGRLKDDARKFNGFGNFYSKFGSASFDSKLTSHYVFNGAKASNPSTAAYRSIWMVNWGNMSMRGFYPQGSKGGISKGEFKKVDVTTTDEATYEAYRQYFRWNLGLDIRDFRYAGRLCNLELDKMLETSGQPSYIELIDQLEARVMSSNDTRRVWYMDKLVWEKLQTLFGRATRTNAITFATVDQRLQRKLFGCPVRLCEALGTNEEAVASI